MRRIRVNNNNPSPAATYASPATSPYQGVPVQYAHTVPAVATYRPAPVAAYSPAAQVSQQHHVTGQYRPVAYAPQPQYYAAAPAPQVAAAPRQKVVQLAPRPVLKAQKVVKDAEAEEEEYASDVSLCTFWISGFLKGDKQCFVARGFAIFLALQSKKRKKWKVQDSARNMCHRATSRMKYSGGARFRVLCISYRSK